ncbi:MAG: hypothetical protein KAV00_02085 [Phycisphaerae bacterium]|nr:hypothetical protein [Phycisphaerae bacterium]
MAASTAVPFKNTVLKMIGAGPETSQTNMTTIAELTSLDGPGITREAIEVTNTDSDNDSKEYVRGEKDGGVVSFDCNWLPWSTNQTLFSTEVATDISVTTTASFAIVCADAATTVWTFNGIATGWKPSGSMGGKLSASGTIQVTGTSPIDS